MGQLVTIPLGGYAPDLDPAQPGVLSYCQDIEATARGWKLRRAYAATYTASGGAVPDANDYLLSGAVTQTTAGTEVLTLAYWDNSASKYKLLVGEGSALVDESRGAFYSSGIEAFSFAQYGNYTVATNLTDVLQIRDATTTDSFADSAATGIPKAKIAVTWGPPIAQTMMLLHINDGTEYSDGWHNSSLGGPTASWTPSVASGAVKHRLLGAGAIRCAVAFQDSVIAFGDRSMWLGRWVGAPNIVEFFKISDEVGCIGAFAAKVVNGVLYWVSEQGLWQWSGAGLPQKAPFPIQNELIATLAGLGSSKRLVQVVADGSVQRLQIAIRSGGYASTVTFAKWYNINLLSGKVSLFSRNTTPYQLVLDRKYVVACSATAGASGDTVAYLEGTSVNATALGDGAGFGLNFMGADKGDTKIQTLMPRFVTAPNSYRMTDYFGPTMSEVTSTATAVDVSATPWRADILKTARWHAPRVYFSYTNADVEVVDVVVEVVKAGNA